MIFKERKKKWWQWRDDYKYRYDCEDVFGTMTIKSKIKLDANILDNVSQILLHSDKEEIETKTLTAKINKVKWL